jgi:hypothetical protein
VDPKLDFGFPDKLDKKDSNNGINEEYTRLVIGLSVYVKQ